MKTKLKTVQVLGIHQDKGNIEVSGTLSFQADPVALPKILEVFFGSSVGGVYSYASNTKKFSWCFDDGVKRYRFANIYPKSLKISSSAGQKVVCEIELIGVTSEARVDNAFPTATKLWVVFLSIMTSLQAVTSE